MYTLKETLVFQGVGIHSGHPVLLTLQPSVVPGIRFIRTDLNFYEVPLSLSTLSFAAFSTLLEKEGVMIKTPEHLLAACHGHLVSGLTVLLDSEELPILDGSAQLYSQAFLKVGFSEISKPHPIVIQKPIYVFKNDASIVAFPDTISRFSYFLSYPNTCLNEQSFSVALTSDSFDQQISPARTFGFLSELRALQEKGFAKGAQSDNVLGIAETGYLSSPRFQEEPARHKLLDLIGDTWVFNRPIQGHIVGIKSGHSLTAEFVQRLSKEKEFFKKG